MELTDIKKHGKYVITAKSGKDTVAFFNDNRDDLDDEIQLPISKEQMKRVKAGKTVQSAIEAGLEWIWRVRN